MTTTRMVSAAILAVACLAQVSAAQRAGSVSTAELYRRLISAWSRLDDAPRGTGTVRVRITVSKEGKVGAARAISGPVAMRGAATDAVKGWRFMSGGDGDVTGVVLVRFGRGLPRGSTTWPVLATGERWKEPDLLENAGTVGGVPGGVPGGEPRTDGDAPPMPAPPDVEPAPAPERPTVTRVSGGVLAGRAIEKPQPEYPLMARQAGVTGAVVVEVIVSEQGRIISARAISGHPLLRDAAVQAARGWIFQPTELEGVPVKVIGTITFNFRKS